MSSRLRPSISLLFSTLLVGLFACGDDGGDELGDDVGSESDTTATGDGDGTGDGTDTGDTGDTSAATVTVSGDAFAFGPYTMLPGAEVTILELPEFMVVTDAAGHFEFPALPAGAAATFRFEKDGNPVVHTKTFTLPAEGVVERVSFQVPDDSTFAALAQIVGIVPDPGACQIASTVTRVGKSVYDQGAHGEAGATVTIEPALPVEQGPIYFNDAVIPQKDLVETSTDGGVLYTNVPPGTYTLTAHKSGVEFESVTVRCEAGVLVNPSPPYGLQAL
ncbi:MAG: carboxypeptidase regulatory-like domain-containing protein [Myxococcales bacterium]|nr:carboxypeptidase regulatory-like domain-containing protein [Myxococcales bacterium]